MLGVFPVNQYLENDSLRQTAIAAAKYSPDIEEAADRPSLAPFHPLTMEEFKRRRDCDVYAVMVIHGRLVRTRAVIIDGFAQTNPPPAGYVCDSCHTKGWLKQTFQDSPLDGANVAAWLCPECSRLKPEERGIRF